MNPNGSVTLWLEALRGQDNDAARQLWQRYFQRMVGLARKRLAGVDLRAFDEEDVALSAFNAFCMSLKDGRYPDLQHRDELWPFLTRITVRKARDWHQKHTALKRVPPGEQVSGSGIIDGNPSPDVEAIMQEECQRLIDSLDEPVHVRVALLKLDGYRNQEIAKTIGYTRRTVERMLQLIRERWSDLTHEDSE